MPCPDEPLNIGFRGTLIPTNNVIRLRHVIVGTAPAPKKRSGTQTQRSRTAFQRRNTTAMGLGMATGSPCGDSSPLLASTPNTDTLPPSWLLTTSHLLEGSNVK